jgi:DHA1 family bicyclomycin/chloramphenicol resistance-like MFS transporter
MNEMETESVKSDKQKYLGNKGLIFYIAIMNMFVPLSTDMYLPALPQMSEYFGSNSSITNLTLIAFFVFYALGILLWGPLSDKYGRKPILLMGSFIYIIGSISCALSASIYFMIFARIIQAVGAGGITSISIAIIKDCYSGKKREVALAITQTIAGLAPMIAPVIGALILQFFNWRGTFWTLAMISAINLTLAFFYQETLMDEEKFRGTLTGSFGRLYAVAKNKSFIIPAIIFSFSALPFMGFLAVSSFIYVNYFGLSAQVYSYFFAANSLVSLLGPTIYVKFLGKVEKKNIPVICFGAACVSRVLVVTIGRLSPVFFWGSFLIMSLAGTTMRPFSTNTLLEQNKGSAGSTSSLISTLFTVMGSIGMSIASLPWGNFVIALGGLITVFSLISLTGWYFFMKSDVPCIGIKQIDSTLPV